MHVAGTNASAQHTGAQDAGPRDRTTGAALSDIVSVDGVPTSFGVFRPTGWMMIGLPAQASADALIEALHAAGWSSSTVLHFAPEDSVRAFEAMSANASAMSGFGFDITLVRRYAEMSRAGHRWLLVQADSDAAADSATAMARACGATQALHYRSLTVEELI
jgi:hypothetical protein